MHWKLHWPLLASTSRWRTVAPTASRQKQYLDSLRGWIDEWKVTPGHDVGHVHSCHWLALSCYFNLFIVVPASYFERHDVRLLWLPRFQLFAHVLLCEQHGPHMCPFADETKLSKFDQNRDGLLWTNFWSYKVYYWELCAGNVSLWGHLRKLSFHNLKMLAGQCGRMKFVALKITFDPSTGCTYTMYGYWFVPWEIVVGLRWGVGFFKRTRLERWLRSRI